MLLDLGLLILRLVVGLLFVGHGAQKLFGWFNGPGLRGTEGFMASLGLRPARFWTLIVGLAEFLGGAALALGLLTPIAAAALIGVMLVAITRVHLPKGLWNHQGGYEFNLTLLTAAVAFGLSGPGAYALDAWLPLTLPRFETFLVSVAVATIGAAIALISGQRQLQPANHTS